MRVAKEAFTWTELRRSIFNAIEDRYGIDNTYRVLLKFRIEIATRNNVVEFIGGEPKK